MFIACLWLWAFDKAEKQFEHSTDFATRMILRICYAKTLESFQRIPASSNRF